MQRKVRLRLAEMWGTNSGGANPSERESERSSVAMWWHVIETIVFESRPAFFVTANLYRPKQVKGWLPATIFPLGHSDNGKAAVTYQKFPIVMARNGFICLNWHPGGEGERLQFWDIEKQRRLARARGNTACSASSATWWIST